MTSGSWLLWVAWLLVPAATALLTRSLTRALISQASRVGLDDVPNHRSSHQEVTPRGGGAAFVVATSLAVIAVLASGIVPSPGPGWLVAMAGCLGLAVVGLIDDLRTLGQGLRLACQFLAVTLILVAGFGDGDRVGTPLATLATLPSTPAGWLLVAGVALAAVWWVNLFNFMDGIDGLAVSEALFLMLAYLALRLHAVSGDPAGLAALDLVDWLAVLMASALIGFLPSNWSPARIFMGDAGSLFLGVAIFLVAMHGVTSGRISAWFWPIAAASFICDASVTLARRLTRGRNVFAAHRSHLYQRLSRRWSDHRRVTLVYSVINISWFLPLALLSHACSRYGGALLIAAYAPALLLAWLGGAGTDEDHRRHRRRGRATDFTDLANLPADRSPAPDPVAGEPEPRRPDPDGPAVPEERRGRTERT